MIKLTLDSIVKLPLQIPSETSVRSKKDEPKKISGNKPVPNTEAIEHTDNTDDVAQRKMTVHSKGYIKYPRYEFF